MQQKRTQERIYALDAIGFDWVLEAVKDYGRWNSLIKLLKNFKEEHGH